jgi:hypothetical protein
MALSALLLWFSRKNSGLKGLSEIERGLKKLREPIDLERKKSGGRQHRKMKERLGMIELDTEVNQIKVEKVRILKIKFSFYYFLF